MSMTIARAVTTGIFLFVLCVPLFVSAAEKTTKDLEKAIKSGQKFILFEGKENEDITVKSGVSIVGTDPGKAIIYGDIKLENGSSLSNLTVIGKQNAITVAKGASVTLTNVTVRGGADSGIYSPMGGGTITLRNSRVTKNRKGLYILSGKNLVLSGNSISENREEGLDARAATSGTISGNQFLNNGEGGAEIIAGSSRLVIQKNTFAGNKASGLALQSYSGNGKAAGSVMVRENTFANNGNYGLTCDSPSLGGAGVAFYAATIKAFDNSFRGNKEGVISRECGIVNRLTPPSQTAEEAAMAEEAAELAAEDLRTKNIAEFTEKVNRLHEREHSIEQQIAEKETQYPVWGRSVMRVPESERAAIEAAFQEIGNFRSVVAMFSVPSEDIVFEDRRQGILAESVRREHELRAAFERLKQRSFPFAFLMFLF